MIHQAYVLFCRELRYIAAAETYYWKNHSLERYWLLHNWPISFQCLENVSLWKKNKMSDRKKTESQLHVEKSLDNGKKSLHFLHTWSIRFKKVYGTWLAMFIWMKSTDNTNALNCMMKTIWVLKFLFFSTFAKRRKRNLTSTTKSWKL